MMFPVRGSLKGSPPPPRPCPSLSHGHTDDGGDEAEEVTAGGEGAGGRERREGSARDVGGEDDERVSDTVPLSLLRASCFSRI